MSKIINFLIILILVLPAVVLSPWTINSVELPKTAIFLLLALWLAFFYFLYKINQSKSAISSEQKIILIAVAILAGLKFLNLLFSPNKDISFWGSYIRQDGLIVQLFLMAFFIILFFTLKNAKQVGYYLLTISLTACLIALYGILQKFNIDFINWEAGAHVRVAATLGNPLFLSSFLLFTIFLSLYNFKTLKNIYLKIANGLSIVLQVIALVFTASSSGWLALCGVILFGLIIYLWPKNKKIAIGVLSVTIISAVFLFLILSGVIKFQPVYNLLADFSPRNPSNLQRLYVWDSAYKALLHKPIFGWGNELFSDAFDYTKNTRLVPPLESSFDRAHNLFLDMAVAEGLPVLLTYLFIIFYSLYLAVKKYFISRDWLYLICASLLIGLLINFSFNFLTLTNYILLYFTLALIYFQPQPEAENTNEQPKLIYPLIALVFCLLLSWVFIKPVLADFSFTQNLNEKDGNKKIADMVRAIKYWPYREYKIELFKVEQLIIAQVKNKNAQLLSTYQQKAQQLTSDLIKNYANNYTVNLLAAKNYSNFDLNKMNQYCQAAIKVAPLRQDVYWYCGDLYLNSGDLDTAIVQYQAAINLDPSVPYPYVRMSEFYAKLKDADKAKQYLKQAQDLGWQ